MASGICTSRLPPRLFPSLQQYNTASRSEEHTSELQSQSNLVCRLLLEKKKTNGVLVWGGVFRFDPVRIVSVVMTRFTTERIVITQKQPGDPRTPICWTLHAVRAPSRTR